MTKTTSNMKIMKLFLACLLGASLSACGESDLVDIHEEALDDAIAADVSLEPAAAQPDSETDPVLPSSIDISEYDLVFSDEFNSLVLDDTKWGTSLWGQDTIIYNQLQYYVDTLNSEDPIADPFSFDGQSLSISATMTPDEQRAAANEQTYLSGLLTTRDTFAFTYGYVEVRVNVEQGRGIWPSLWMLGSDFEELAPELYVFEYDGSKQDSVFHNYNYRDADGNLRSPGQQEVELSGLSEGFHTIGLRWRESELLFYVDGQPTYRIIGENVPSEDMYLILNLAMGGLWTGAPDATTPDPASLEVDYIRVYQERSQ
ncbi:MAG: family 16 glycosylhydrolase [Granulosicoccus sp.]